MSTGLDSESLPFAEPVPVSRVRLRCENAQLAKVCLDEVRMRVLLGRPSRLGR